MTANPKISLSTKARVYIEVLVLKMILINEEVLYSNVVNSPKYTMRCTRPNIYYMVGLVSDYQSNPRQLGDG